MSGASTTAWCTWATAAAEAAPQCAPTEGSPRNGAVETPARSGDRASRNRGSEERANLADKDLLSLGDEENVRPWL